jgi:hypothetical protein
VLWKNGGKQYSMRVGLYRPKMTPGNAWRDSDGSVANSGPATRYTVMDEGERTTSITSDNDNTLGPRKVP